MIFSPLIYLFYGDNSTFHASLQYRSLPLTTEQAYMRKSLSKSLSLYALKSILMLIDIGIRCITKTFSTL